MTGSHPVVVLPAGRVVRTAPSFGVLDHLVGWLQRWLFICTVSPVGHLSLSPSFPGTCSCFLKACVRVSCSALSFSPCHKRHDFSCSWFVRLSFQVVVQTRSSRLPSHCWGVEYQAFLQTGTCWIFSHHSHLQDHCEYSDRWLLSAAPLPRFCGRATTRCCFHFAVSSYPILSQIRKRLKSNRKKLMTDDLLYSF